LRLAPPVADFFMPVAETLPANVSAIERELRQLWKGEAQEQSDHPVVSARTLNLVVYFPEGEDPEQTSKLLTPISAQHPSRVIAILPHDEKSVPDLKIRVSAACQLALEGRRNLGCELISIQAAPSGEQRLPSLVSSLLLPDLPSFLWWRNPFRIADSIAQELASQVGHVIVDSAEFENPWESLSRLRSILNERCSGSCLRDLAWSRLTLWRQLIAQFFDGTHAPFLKKLTRVGIEYYPGPSGDLPSEAILLAAWMASCLKCGVPDSFSRLERAGQNSLSVQSGNGKLVFEFSPRATGGRGVARAHLIAGNEPSASFCVSRTDNGTGLATTAVVGQSDPVRRIVRAADRKPVEMVGRELEILARDDLYETVLATALAITGNRTPR